MIRSLAIFLILLFTSSDLSAQTHTMRSLHGPDGASIYEIDISPDGRFFVSTSKELYYHGPTDLRFSTIPRVFAAPSIAIDSNGKVYYSDANGVGTVEGQILNEVVGLSPFKTKNAILIVDRTTLTIISGSVFARLINGNWVYDTLPGGVGDVQIKGDTLVASTGAGLYYKVEGADIEWTKIGSQISGSIRTFELTPIGLIAGTRSQGVWISDRIGGELRSISNNLDDWQINDVLYSDGRIYTSHPNNIYTTSDLGETWIEGQDRIRTLRVDALAAHNGVVYAASDGLFISEDQGESWRALNVGFAESQVSAIIEYKGDVWTGSTLSAVHKYWPSGDSWLDQNRGLRSNGTVMKFIVHADTLYALEQRGGLFKWRWDSSAWVSVPLTFSVSSLYYDMEMLDERTAVIVSESVHILDLVTGAFTRKQFGEFQIRDVEVANNKIYLASDSGLFASADRGITWEGIGVGRFYKVAVVGGVIVTEVSATRLLRSTDEGKTWDVLDERLDDLHRIDDKLYAIRNITYVSSDKGTTWQPFADKSISELHSMYKTSTGQMLVGVNSEGLMEAVTASGVADKIKAPAFRIGTSPNPFASKLTITYEPLGAATVEINIYNEAGQVVASLLRSGSAEPGTHSIEWDARDLPSGAYIVEVRDAVRIESSKVMLTR